jgi:hypothetical protein
MKAGAEGHCLDDVPQIIDAGVFPDASVRPQNQERQEVRPAGERESLGEMRNLCLGNVEVKAGDERPEVR